MEFYLTNDQSVKVWNGEPKVTTSIFSKLEPECLQTSSGSIRSLYDYLHSWADKLEVTSTFCVSIGRPIFSSTEETLIQLHIRNDSRCPNVLQRLIEICGNDNVKINLAVNVNHPEISIGNFEARDLPITDVWVDWVGYRYGCEFRAGKVYWPSNWESFPTALVTARLILNDEAATQLFKFPEIQKIYETNRSTRALQVEGVSCDLVIVAAEGEEVNCHKDILAGESEVFKAMFEHGMKEDATGRLEMPDMSESGIRALLDAIYHWNFEKASANSEVALELLRAGQKYLIYDLTFYASLMICEKPNDWFNVDMAVDLLRFARNLTKGENTRKDELGTKAVKAIQWFSKREPKRLLDSVEYRELFHNSPDVAMELTTLLLKHGDDYKDVFLLR